MIIVMVYETEPRCQFFYPEKLICFILKLSFYSKIAMLQFKPNVLFDLDLTKSRRQIQ